MHSSSDLDLLKQEIEAFGHTVAKISNIRHSLKHYKDCYLERKRLVATHTIHEVQSFLTTKNIDLMLISETHFTKKNHSSNSVITPSIHHKNKAHGSTCVITHITLASNKLAGYPIHTPKKANRKRVQKCLSAALEIISQKNS